MPTPTGTTSREAIRSLLNKLADRLPEEFSSDELSMSLNNVAREVTGKDKWKYFELTGDFWLSLSYRAKERVLTLKLENDGPNKDDCLLKREFIAWLAQWSDSWDRGKAAGLEGFGTETTLEDWLGSLEAFSRLPKELLP